MEVFYLTKSADNKISLIQIGLYNVQLRFKDCEEVKLVFLDLGDKKLYEILCLTSEVEKICFIYPYNKDKWEICNEEKFRNEYGNERINEIYEKNKSWFALLDELRKCYPEVKMVNLHSNSISLWNSSGVIGHPQGWPENIEDILTGCLSPFFGGEKVS